MNDERREAVAKAMFDEEAKRFDIDYFWSDMEQRERDIWLRHADAALAAMASTEPTDAEVEEIQKHLNATSGRCVLKQDIRAALIAAQNVRRGEN